jgi:hypothetical protein
MGEDVSIARQQSAALTLTTPVAELTVRTVHGYFTGLLARTKAGGSLKRARRGGST